VIEERSVQRAAERVFRTQTAVSIALGKLEDHVGIALLDRARRRDYRLTQAGELLYKFAWSMLAMRNEVVSTLNGKATGGVFPSARAEPGACDVCKRSLQNSATAIH
jgi:DNA-binding transcriptional LysR family regulator